jgi:hypothetical protein
MSLLAAALLFAACAVGAVVFIKLYRKRKKARYAVLAIMALVIGAAAFIYAGLTVILAGGMAGT